MVYEHTNSSKRNKKGQFIIGNIPYLKGKTHTIEARKKISKKGKGRIPWNKSIPWNEKVRKKMSLSHSKLKLTKKHKENIGKATKKWWLKNRGTKTLKERNRKVSKAKLGKNNPNYGKSIIHSPETLEKIRQSKLGAKSHFWRGGKSFELYGIEFNNKLKEQIRTRDQYRCQECFRHQNELYTKTGKKYKLGIHHIDYNKKNNCLSNLLSLCKPCYMQTNFNRKDWTAYFSNRQEVNL